MYQALLTRRYLTSKIMPLLSALAVLLCTAMVLVVWSVMGGFLVMLLDTGKTIIGDAAIDVGLPAGIPFYVELIEELEAHPDILAAAPVISTPGMVTFGAEQTRFANILGVEPESFDRVTGFFGTQHWKPLDEPLAIDTEGIDFRARDEWKDEMLIAQDAGRTLLEVSPITGVKVPAAVPGIEMSQANRRVAGGLYRPTWMIGFMEDVTVSVLQLSARGSVSGFETRKLPIANEFASGFYEHDARLLIMPLGLLQKMMGLTAGRLVIESQQFTEVTTDENGEERFVPFVYEREIPAKVTEIRIKASAGVSPKELDTVVEALYLEHFERHPDDVILTIDGTGPEAQWRRFFVYSWEEKPEISTLMNAVKKETGLLLILFGFISLTAVFLVLAIFWSMISEKTRDIGILRAVGASRWGVSWLFVRYGLAVGIVGSVSGVALAYAIVWNINTIHAWLGSALGLVIWDPATYYFSEIPSDVDPTRALLVLGIGIIASTLGALVPAIRAGFYDPVKALRFE